MSTLASRELDEIETADSSGKPVVVFIHGLWLLSSSWNRWRRLFEERGFATIAPGWPDDPETVAEANEHPEVFAKKMIGVVTDHYLDAIARLHQKPVVVGHSFGGLIAQKIAGTGVASSTVAIDPAPFRGVLPLPLSALKSSSAVLHNPANFNRAVALTFEQFTFGWANNLDPEQAQRLYDEFLVPASGAPIFQAATANLIPWTEAKVDTKASDRGPLLIIAGEDDNTVPLAITHAMFDQQRRNSALTEIDEIADRGHSLTIDDGWADVAQRALEFALRTSPVVETGGVA